MAALPAGVAQAISLDVAGVSQAALNSLIGFFRVPPFLLPIYRAAAADYGIPWEVLAGINEIETDYGRNLSVSSAGAVGWMQFLPSSWARFAVNASGNALANPYDPVDAIFTAARYLRAAGAQHDLRSAIYAYNHAGWYVDSVQLRAQLLRLLPQSLVDELSGLLEGGWPVAGDLGAEAHALPAPASAEGRRPAAHLSAPAGAAVIAVADSRVVSLGESPRLGHYITLEDSYGNRFTYSGLSSLEPVYPRLNPRVEPISSLASRLGSGVASTFGLDSAASAAAPTARVVRTAPARAKRLSGAVMHPLAKERLFAAPQRPASYAAGGSLQLASSGPPSPSPGAYAAEVNAIAGVKRSRALAQALQLEPGTFTLEPLARGATLAAGTLLGRAGSGREPGITFQIRPVGAQAAIDPLPILDSWELLGRLSHGAAALVGVGRWGAFGSLNPTLGQLLMGGHQQLAQAVLGDPRVTLDGCAHQDIAAGAVDWRALAAIEYLSYSGLAPGVTGLSCGSTAAAPATQLDITTLAGTPIAGHQQDGGPVDWAVRELLGLQGALRPSRIVSLRAYASQTVAVASSAHAHDIEVDFAPTSSPAITTPTWQRLASRLEALSGVPVQSTALVAAPVKRRVAASAATVTLVVPPSPLRGSFELLQAYATPLGGTTISQVDFQYSPAGQNQWQTFDTQTTPVSGVTYNSFLDTQGLNLQNGPYDLRAVATDSSGNQATSAVQDGVVANNATYVSLTSTGTPVAGTVTLTATPEPGGATPNTVTFQICPSSQNCAANPTHWTTVGTVGPQLDPTGNPTGNYVTTLDTTTLAAGSYDLSLTAEDGGVDTFQGAFSSGVLVDNTPPSVTLTDPGGPLSGVVTLDASASDAGSGVDAVKFQVSPTGAGSWNTIAVATSPPYRARFDTRQLAPGSYDLRVEATDDAGNVADSPILSGVSVTSSATQPFNNLTVTNYVAPASNISLLGEIAGNPEHETWALGQTNAPPPDVGGSPLPYTVQGAGQLVLLRYLDSTGWEIVDVLRNPDGTAFQLLPGGTYLVGGQMNAAGEAWLVVHEHQVVGSHQQNLYGAFHRVPGGPFLLDSTATPTLKPLFVSGVPSLRLGVASDGTTYGMLVPAPGVGPSSSVSGTPSPVGPVTVNTHFAFASLAGGTWTIQNPTSLPAGYTAPSAGVTISLDAADATGPGTGWAALDQTVAGSTQPILASFDSSGYHFVSPTGLDALDFSGEFAAGSPQSVGASPLSIKPTAIRADSAGVWISAAATGGQLVARYDFAAGRVVDSWCTGLPRRSFGCGQPLDLSHPATVPDAVFSTAAGPVADALSVNSNFIDVYAYGTWTSVFAPGYQVNPNGAPVQSLFVDPSDGWLVGANTLGRVSASAGASALASWPEANRNPLLSVALPPGQSTTSTPGALAVGLHGTALHYDSSAGWQVDSLPAQTHHLELTGVAFNGPSSAFAVGQGGTILHWNGTSWAEDAQSSSLTTTTLNAVAFGSDGQGWAVGGFGAILHYDGSRWSAEQIDPADSGADVTSVAVAGSDVFAVAGGNLITRQSDGTWQQVGSALLPSPAPPSGSLRLVSGLPDGGVAVAGKSLLMLRDSTSASFQYAPQSFQGIPVALAPFRSAGSLQVFVSVAPPITTSAGPSTDVGGFPAGDGDLILQTPTGWDDLSHAQYPTAVPDALGDGVVQPDPVLAVASSPDGTHAWAVGGYSGTHAADGVGTDQILSARPAGWFTSAIWRYDTGGSAQSPATTQAQVSLPATPGTVSFAFFSSPLCKVQCAAVQNAQPSVNLAAAAGEISAFAQQPGGPAFAMLGGNAVGPIDVQAYHQGAGALDLARLPSLVSALGTVPLYAAYGPLDSVPTSANPWQPWARVFASAPAPFGSGAVPAGITPLSSGDAAGPVNRYYAFDITQNGGTLRVIVLDNSAGSLEASASGQTAWLTSELADAQASSRPVVVIAALPLDQTSDGMAVATQLAGDGVLGVFTSAGGQGTTLSTQVDQVVELPFNPDPTNPIPQVPDYEGATLTYQQPKNNGVLWYDVSVDTAGRQLSVQGIPVISSLVLEPLDGLSAARSSTLSFQAIARRPAATLATTPDDSAFPGYNQYVSIPAGSCKSCVAPSYTFTSSNPAVGDFVVPSAPGSPYPKLNAKGKTTHSAASGLFCAFNGGTTLVSVTSGLLTSSLTVNVADGGFGPPCGTVPGGSITHVINIPGGTVPGQSSNPQGGTPPPPPATTVTLTPNFPPLTLPVPPPPPVHRPVVVPPPVYAPPAVPTPVPIAPESGHGTPPVVPPLIPPPVTPVPPGGATVSAQAAARREEKARKHASQSAYITRPAGVGGGDWFYPAVGVAGVLAMLLAAGGLRPGPGRRSAPALLWLPGSEPSERQRRRR